MKVILLPFFSLLLPLTLSPAYAQNEPELKLESVVIVSRHGVRAPTKATSLMQDVTPDAWPTWPVKLGWLTPRGGELVSYLGHYQRQRLVADGLLAKKDARNRGRSRLLPILTNAPVKRAKLLQPDWRPAVFFPYTLCQTLPVPTRCLIPLKPVFANWIRQR